MARKPVLLDERGYRKFGMRDKLGYMFGGLANSITFIFPIVFLIQFYTSFMGLSVGLIGAIIIMVHLLSVFAAPVFGRICDKTPRRPAGKFKPCLMRMAIPVSISVLVMFVAGYDNFAADWSHEMRVFWLIFTSLLWACICFSGIHIPYGAMISSITPDAENRLSLSIFRVIGTALAYGIVCAVLPLMTYESLKLTDSITAYYLNGEKIVTAAMLVAVVALICYILCYKLVIEREETDAYCASEKPTFAQMLKSAVKDRATRSVMAASVLLFAAQVSAVFMSSYVYLHCYQDTSMSIGGLTIAVGMMTAALIAKPLAVRLGKAELSTVASIASAVICLLIWLLQPSVYVYMALTALQWLCMGITCAVFWAMICDVIDHAELNNGIREDGSIYGLCASLGSLGQAIALGRCILLLKKENVLTFAQSVKDGVFTVASVIPAVCMLLLAQVLWFLYPLRKNVAAENSQLWKKKHRR